MQQQVLWESNKTYSEEEEESLIKAVGYAFDAEQDEVCFSGGCRRTQGILWCEGCPLRTISAWVVLQDRSIAHGAAATRASSSDASCISCASCLRGASSQQGVAWHACRHRRHLRFLLAGVPRPLDAPVGRGRAGLCYNV
jgi:hypothetical protein